MRKAQGIPLATKSEISLCRPCYAKHKAGLDYAAAKRIDHDTDLWRLWLDGDISDESLLGRVFDKAAYREQVARVKSHRDVKKPTKSKRNKRDDGAVYG